MNYSNIKEYDIANGPGIRYTLFVSGCTHHCKGCFNPETWDFAHGKPFTKDIEDHILEEVGQEYYEGLTLLGGEPMEPSNQKGLLSLVTRFKERYPQKTIWCFSGYLFDRDLLGRFAKIMPETMELLKRIDVLVDGEFMLDKKDVTLLFKGSSNQRTIDVPKASPPENHCLGSQRYQHVSEFEDLGKHAPLLCSLRCPLAPIKKRYPFG